jgi:hypothetical protein
MPPNNPNLAGQCLKLKQDRCSGDGGNVGWDVEIDLGLKSKRVEGRL